MSQREVALVGSNNTKAEITGQQELRIQVSSVTPGAGLASEATLLQVLSAVDNMRDYEVRLVQDSTAPNPVTWLEVRYWDAQSGTLGVPVYYLPGSTTPGSPVLPISYINDQSLLTQILGELQAIDNKLVSGNDIGDVTVNNAAGAAAVNIQDGGNSITVDDGGSSITVDGTVAATQSGTWNIASITGPVALPTGAATEATLGVLNSQFIAATRTPALIRTATSGTIPAGARSISVFNAGAAAGSILGVAGNILPGEVFEFSAGGENDTLAAFAYNGTGTTLVITSIV